MLRPIQSETKGRNSTKATSQPLANSACTRVEQDHPVSMRIHLCIYTVFF